MKQSAPQGTYRRLLKEVIPFLPLFLLALLGSGIYSSVDAFFTYLMKPLLNQGFINRDETFISFLPLIIIVIFFIRGGASFISSYCMARVGRSVVQSLRNKMFKQFNKMPSQFYDNATSGQLLSKIIYNVDQVADATTNAVTTMVQASVLIIGLLVVMFINNWRISLLYLIAAPAIALIIRFSSRRMRRVSGREQDRLGDITHVAEECIEGYREVRSFGGQDYENQKFAEANRNNRDQALKVVVTKSLSTVMVQIVGAFILAITLYLATHNTWGSNLTAGGFISLLFAMVMLLKPLKDITNVNNIIQRGLAGAQSVFELLDETPEPDNGTATLTRAQGKLQYSNVQFSYPTADTPALHDISFTVNPGETVAIVGHSGGGKSTLVSLLPRFYEIDAGQISLDGMSIDQLTLHSLRDQLATVSQHVVLFNDTIAHNVAYGRLKDATEADIWQALEQAHAKHFVEKLPEGLNSLVGENGVLLSGGQRQRLAIARAILKDAPVLILDEATSALDTESERHIQAALDELIKTRTTLVIAHRLSTIEKADTILVMENGRIIETGKHQELLAKQGYYARLYQMQFRDQQS